MLDANLENLHVDIHPSARASRILKPSPLNPVDRVGTRPARGETADDTDLNVSKSGASVSRRVSRRLRLNSRGGGSFRLLRGLSWRFGRRR